MTWVDWVAVVYLSVIISGFTAWLMEQFRDNRRYRRSK